MMVSLLVACDVPSPPAPSLPWIHGLSAATVRDTPTSQAAQRIANLLASSTQDDYGALELQSDVTGDSRAETILASYSLGIVVSDAAGRVLTRVPGFAAEGSADELLAIASGNAQLGVPVVLAAVQTGGHRETTISLAIYGMIGGATLRQVFFAPIEIHEGDRTAAGSLTFVPAGLLYRAPDAQFTKLWTYDVRSGRYLEPTPAPTNAAPGRDVAPGSDAAPRNI